MTPSISTEASGVSCGCSRPAGLPGGSTRRRPAPSSLRPMEPSTMRHGLQSFLPLLAALALAGALPAAAGEAATDRVVAEGLAVELSLKPLDGGAGPLKEGQTARVRLTLTDTLSHTPMSRLYPGAWMDRLDAGPPGEPAAASCKQKVEAIVGGAILSRPELDLNTYYVLTLNADATISVVDPLFGYGSSKLLGMVFLRSPGEDWALAADGNRLFVSLPDSGRVAAVDTAAWKVTGEVETGARPRRLGLQPDGQYLWVAGDTAVSVIDAAGLRKVKDIKTGRGEHDLAFSDDSRFVFVTNEEDGTVSVLDTARLI